MDNMEEIIKETIKGDISKQIDEEIEVKATEFIKQLITNRDKYIAEIMRGIRIVHEQDNSTNSMNYRIIFENISKLEDNK